MVTQYRKKLDEYERGHPQSRKNLLKTIRLMGDSEARLQFPVLHPDHIKNASNVLHMVADAFKEIANARRTNAQKVFEVRGIIHMANHELADYAKDDMLYVRGLTVLDYYKR